MEEGREKPPTIPAPWTPRGDGGQDEKRPPPKTQRRAREVSSRYLAAIISPVPPPTSASIPNLPPQPPKKPQAKQKLLFSTPSVAARRSVSPPLRRDQRDSEDATYGDENNWKPEALLGFQRGKESERRIFRENDCDQLQNQKINDASSSSRVVGSRILSSGNKIRPGTPIGNEKNAPFSVTPRSAGVRQKRARSAQTTISKRGPIQRYPESPDHDGHGCTSPENSQEKALSDTEICSSSGPQELGFCESPTIHGQSNRSRKISECRSSMPVADSSQRYRSLDTAFFNCNPRQSHPTLSVSKSLKDNSISAKTETATGKGKKNSARQEESHSLRMLHNKFLQWRFLNAKANVASKSRAISAERSLYSLSSQLPGLRDSVAAKRIELNRLKTLANASGVLEAQTPLLSEWSSLEEEHSDSLSSLVKALLDASVRLPVSADLKADVREIIAALSSATNVLESLASRVGGVLDKLEGMKDVASDLAEVVNEERARIEECGDLLAEAHANHVKEYSLRANLIQRRKF